MIKILIITLFFLVSFLFGDKDFYYSYIDKYSNQISQKEKKILQDGFDTLDNIRQLSKEDKLFAALRQLKVFKSKNRLKVLEQDILILYAQLALDKHSTKDTIKSCSELEDAVNSSKISAINLADVYYLLIQLKINLHKGLEAKYFAETLIENYTDEYNITRGKIGLAKVYAYQRNYTKAEKILYKILTQTKNKYIATLVADELFSIYVKGNKRAKAMDLIEKIINKNLQFYVNNIEKAKRKIKELKKLKFYEYAVEILNALLENTVKPENIERIKFELAGIYMEINDKTNYYMQKAFELYTDIINDYPDGIYRKKSKVYIDEILMRKGFKDVNLILKIYSDSETMKQKAILQELLNLKKAKRYDLIKKNEKNFKRISNSIVKRFGYESINKLLEETDEKLVEEYLVEGNCIKMKEILLKSGKRFFCETLDTYEKKDFFLKCILQDPRKEDYLKLRAFFVDTKNLDEILFLEKLSLELHKIDNAYEYSNEIEESNDKKILSREFLSKYKLVKVYKKGNYEDFFEYAEKNPIFMEDNEENPMIIDFYYDYYMYLLNNKNSKKIKILKKLNLMQNKFQVYIYSPFVNFEMAKLYRENKDYDKEKNTLLQALNKSRILDDNDKVRIFYELAKNSKQEKDLKKEKEYIEKCINVSGLKNNYYQKMCKELK